MTTALLFIILTATFSYFHFCPFLKCTIGGKYSVILNLHFLSFENVGCSPLCKTKREVETTVRSEEKNIRILVVPGELCPSFGPRRGERKVLGKISHTEITHTPASCFHAVTTIASLRLAALIQTATLPSAAGSGQWGTLGRKPPDQERGRGRSDAEELQFSATNQLISQTSSLILDPVSLISARRRHWVTAGLPAALPPHTFIYLSFFFSSARSISVSRTALNEF